MIAWLRRLDHFWYAPAPADRLAYVRAIVGAYSVCHLGLEWSSITAAHAAERFRPVGLLFWLTSPLPSSLLDVLLAATLVLGAAFTVGFRHRALAPAYAALALASTSYRSSWGMLFHTDNLLCLHLVLLAAAPAADVLSVDAWRHEHRSRAATDAQPTHGRYGWPLRAMAAVAVMTYFVAGVAKLRASGLDWATGAALQTQVAFDNARKIELGGVHSPLGVWMVSHRAWLSGFAAASLALELLGPLALLSRRAARIWALGMWAFHVGVLVLMAIVFAYPLSGVAYVAFWRPEQWHATRRAREWLRAFATLRRA